MPHAFDAPTLSKAAQSYPVVLLRAGASAQILHYASIAETLASHGFVVVGLDAPYRTRTVVFDDGSVIERLPTNDPEALQGQELERTATRLMREWANDLRFSVDQLAVLNNTPHGRFGTHLDLERLAVVGHSLGGAVAAEFCRADARCKLGVDLDGALHGDVVATGIGRPFTFILSDHRGDIDADSERIMADIEHVAAQNPRGTAVINTIAGANHFGFSDQGLLKSGVLTRVLHALGLMPLAPEQQLAEASRLTLQALEKWLGPARG